MINTKEKASTQAGFKFECGCENPNKKISEEIKKLDLDKLTDLQSCSQQILN